MTDTQLKAAILKTIRKEGGYVNDPVDKGGETKYGISRRSWPDVDVANLTIWQAFDIYRKHYAMPLRVAEVDNPRIGWKVFDVGVNAGIIRAAKLTQESLGMGPDGIDGVIGPRTIRAINATDEATFFMHFIPLLERFYEGIVERDPEQRKFLNGWLSRAADTGVGL
jgi:lysozyme family protein